MRRRLLKALSVKQPYASMIVSGMKTLEIRSWYTKFRGELVIVSSKSPAPVGYPCGCALAIVKLIHVRRGKMCDEVLSKCEIYDDDWCWELEVQQVFDEPIPIKGRQGLYSVWIEVPGK